MADDNPQTHKASSKNRTPIIDLHAHPALGLRLPERPCDTDDDTKRNQLLMDAANRFGNFQRPFDPIPSPRYSLKDAFEDGITFGSVLYNPADEVFGPCEPFANLMKQRQRVHTALAEARYRIVTGAADLKDAIDKHEPAAFHCVEGGYGVGAPGRIEELARAGVAYIILAHLVFRDVSACVNALPFLDDEQYDRMFAMPVPGLTSTGFEMCELMVKFGIIPDITHMTEVAAKQVFDIAARRARPVIVSHGAPRGSFGKQYKLNLGPDTIVAVRDSGGVIGVIFYDHWLLPPGRPPQTKADIEDVIAAMKRIKEVAGTTTCVAIGSDLEGFIHPVEGLEHVGKMRKLEEALRRDSFFTADEVDGILWKNALRTLELGWG